DLPYGAELLAEGDIFEVQAIRVGRAFALQFHPEVTHAMMHRWIVRGHDRLEMPGARPRHTHLTDRAVYDFSGRAWLGIFLKRWLGGWPLGSPSRSGVCGQEEIVVVNGGL